MISNVVIKNFKSIVELSFKTKRINLFIGKPNTGKSNILEALGVFSLFYNPHIIKELVRLENMMNLFWNNESSLEIKIITDNYKWETYKVSGERIGIKIIESETPLYEFIFDTKGTFIQGTAYLRASTKQEEKKEEFPFKFYRFKILSFFPKTGYSFLWPPNGENLLAVLNSNQEIYNFINLILDEFKLNLVIEETQSAFKILKLGPKLILFPYSLLSDTLQRIIFHFVAIKSNQNSILIFEEPEAHSFPYYTKILAEAIALDTKNNQYFISTHNPYFLSPLVEKTPNGNLAIFYVYMKEHQTMIRELSDKEKEDILTGKIDPFFQFSEEQ